MTDWLNGPKLAGWVNRHGFGAHLHTYDHDRATVNAWGRGKTAHVFTADRILTAIGCHISELPADFWCDPPACNAFRYSPEARAAVTSRAQNGEPVVALAKEIGVHPTSIRNWLKAAA